MICNIMQPTSPGSGPSASMTGCLTQPTVRYARGRGMRHALQCRFARVADCLSCPTKLEID
ncbi:hypothetical protein CBM2587_A170195 [Cupriavidus taiwanensis]|uniref:Uncharacterized protein n=1 Tax=Cupriavidus taiwanensis TaxID=164546 RepID=A0A375BN72_9BURK|nr:hypothetical protein CBM2587_A170195 [Cupriavidus taiwanensis]